MKRQPKRFRIFTLAAALAVASLCASACGGTSVAARIPIDPSVFENRPAVVLPLKIEWISTLDKEEDRIEFLPTEFASPTADADRVYVGTSAKRFFALSARDGTKLWRFDPFGAVESAPAALGGYVVFGDSEGIVYCLNARTGLLKWSYKGSGEIMGQPLIAGGRVFINSAYNRIYALSLEKGEWLWMHQRDVPATFTVRGASTPVLDGDRVLVGFSDGYLAALNPEDGKEIWKNLLKIGEQLTDVDSTPVVDGDSIYVGAYDGALYRIGREDGNVKWKLDGGGTASRIVVAGGYLFVAASNGAVIAVDKNTGKKVWDLNIREIDKGRSLAAGPRRRLKVPDAPVLIGDVLLTASSQGFLYAIDAPTGTIRWKYFPGSGVTSGLTLHGNRVYFLGNGGMAFAMAPPKYPISQ